MVAYRAQVVIPFFSQLPRDILTNTFHFDGNSSAGLAADAAVIASRLETFYKAVFNTSGTQANYLLWDDAVVRVTDYAELSPRVPYDVDVDLAVSPGNSAIPTEVAVVLSWRSAIQPGTNPARFHNRIYLGGLGPNAFTNSSASAFPTVSSAFRSAVAGAATALLGANDGDLDWAQASPAPPTVTTRPIVGGWVDDSPDSQRRRSVDPTARTLWP